MFSSGLPSPRGPLCVRLCVTLGMLAAASCRSSEGESPELASTDFVEASTSSTGEDDEGAFFDAQELETISTWLGPIPAVLPPDPTNAWSEDLAAAQLGRRFFFEAGYSADGSVSCATCHIPTAGFDDGRANTSAGIDFTTRASMTLLNSTYIDGEAGTTAWQSWDGRRDSPWAKALEPPENEVEMDSSRTTVALLVLDRYRADYEEVFGPMPALLDETGQPLALPGAKPGMPEWDMLPAEVRAAYDEVYVNFGKAIGAYLRLLVSRNSRFDQFWSEITEGASDSDALTEQEKQGLRVFIGRGRCLGCHGGPNFSDGQFHNIAVAQVGDNVPVSDEGRAGGLPVVLDNEFNCNSPWSDHPDKAQCAVNSLSAAAGERGAFKTPSLRDVVNRAPYMHTGMMSSLDQVVLHYDLGGSAPATFDGTRDELMRPLALSVLERQALVAFMGALSGEPLPAELTTAPR